jgi:hypothetical protein
MRRGGVAIILALALAGCGGTKTIITIEKQTQTVTAQATQTVTVTRSASATTPNVTKCGPNTTNCPVVVGCPLDHARPARQGCVGVVGVGGTNIAGPQPGPDKTGLGLTCSWTQPVFDAARIEYVYVCDPGP